MDRYAKMTETKTGLSKERRAEIDASLRTFLPLYKEEDTSVFTTTLRQTIDKITRGGSILKEDIWASLAMTRIVTLKDEDPLLNSVLHDELDEVSGLRVIAETIIEGVPDSQIEEVWSWPEADGFRKLFGIEKPGHGNPVKIEIDQTDGIAISLSVE